MRTFGKRTRRPDLVVHSGGGVGLDVELEGGLDVVLAGGSMLNWQVDSMLNWHIVDQLPGKRVLSDR